MIRTATNLNSDIKEEVFFGKVMQEVFVVILKHIFKFILDVAFECSLQPVLGKFNLFL